MQISECRFENADNGRFSLADCRWPNVKDLSTNPGAAGDEAWFYLLAALCGIGAGWADVAVNDLLLTALLVLSACILLGMWRPRRPWRWVVVVGAFIPWTELAALKILAVKPTRAQVFGSFLAFLPGIAGSYGGSILRNVMDRLKQGR